MTGRLIDKHSECRAIAIAAMCPLLKERGAKEGRKEEEGVREGDGDGGKASQVVETRVLETAP